MKSLSLIIFCLFSASCSSNSVDKKKSNSTSKKFELAYNILTEEEENKLQPYLYEYNSDASGIKIIPKIYRLNQLGLYSGEHFKNDNAYKTNDIINLSKKYTNSKWRKDKNFRLLMEDEVRKFHGPLKYIYFSEIRNDSLRADVLVNPFAEYYMTTGEHYLVVFKNDSIQSIQKKISHFD